MIVDGITYGVVPFMVPLRRLDNHHLFRGVECGDIGGKMGYNTVDNGYLSFTDYRIPRDNLL